MITHETDRNIKPKKQMKNTELLQNRDEKGRVTARGRKRLEVNFPKNKSKFTVKEVHAANPHIKALPVIYNRLRQMGKLGIVKITSETTETGKRGKPAAIIWKMGAWKAFQTLRKSNKSKAKINAVPAVDITPAPVAAPVAAPEPVTV